MRKILNKKILVIGLISLFLGASAAVGVAKQIKTTPGQNPMGRDWSDNFDTYTNGQLLDGTPDDGGWKGWDNTPSAYGTVTNEQSHSAPNSDKITGASDNVHEYSGYTAGHWAYKAWQYIPADFAGITYFILCSSYIDGGSSTTDVWAVQVHFDSELGLVESEFGGQQLPLITGRWVEIRCDINLDSDWLQIYYDNALLAEHAWSDTVQGSGGGPLEISAVDLFANGASPVYYDDISLAPAGTGFTCEAGGPYTGHVGIPVQFTGSASGGTSPYTWAWTFGDSGTAATQNPTHTYTAVGTYNVTLTVTDSSKAVVTDTTTATISPPAPVIAIGNITGGLGISAVIKNVGTADATGVTWKINLSGGFILVGKSKTGTADITAGGSVTVKDFVIGFGKTTITVTAGTATKTATGTVLLFFVMKVA
jgi:hypothetical protein